MTEAKIKSLLELNLHLDHFHIEYCLAYDLWLKPVCFMQFKGYPNHNPFPANYFRLKYLTLYNFFHKGFVKEGLSKRYISLILAESEAFI